ncbi:hypothetical protein [Smaragdicoccus niigatensis]|uniref:AMIN-like domain-containing (lipo)protein n=1 Tax=Smaragdicoccus niigatensis TaxID=359359 RepID=UPI0003688F4E|nr:hypothetical protein [Smaragdicoccus niigatensis]
MRIVVALASTAVFALAGCSNDDTSGSSNKSLESSMAQATTTATTVNEAPPTGTLPLEGKPSNGARLTVTDMRVGHHTGFDRVVFELGGQGTPGWVANWTDNPTSPGSGKPIDVKGKSILQVRITGLGYPDDTGANQYSGPNPLEGTGELTSCYVTGVYEGESEAFIGSNLDKPKVRIFTLESPARLVVDIASS